MRPKDALMFVFLPAFERTLEKVGHKLYVQLKRLVFRERIFREKFERTLLLKNAVVFVDRALGW